MMQVSCSASVSARLMCKDVQETARAVLRTITGHIVTSFRWGSSPLHPSPRWLRHWMRQAISQWPCSVGYIGYSIYIIAVRRRRRRRQ